jgi:hypothetical protein
LIQRTPLIDIEVSRKTSIQYVTMNVRGIECKGYEWL